MWGGQSGRQSQSEICRKPPDIGDRDGQGLKFTFCKTKFIIYQFDFSTVLLPCTIIYELTYGAGEKFTEIQFKL